MRILSKIKKSVPSAIKLLWRIGRHTLQPHPPSREMPSELISGCRLCASRYELVGLLPKGGRVIEVGTQRGVFARHILAVNEPAELHLVDLDCSELDQQLRRDPRVAIHQGASRDVLLSFPDAHFDWVYIDAGHDYESVTSDAEAAADKVKPGGFLVFDDFAHTDLSFGRYGVHRAVTDFARDRHWSFAWFALASNALYNVALQRPAE